MSLINCTRHNYTHLICKYIYTISECVDSSIVGTSIVESNVNGEESVVINNSDTNELSPIKFPDTIWEVPIIISIVVGACISLLLIWTSIIKIYRNRTITQRN